MGDEKRVSRRRLLRYGGAVGALTLAGCTDSIASSDPGGPRSRSRTVIRTQIGTMPETRTEAPTTTATDTPTQPPTETATEWVPPTDLCRSDPSHSSPGPLKAEFISREKFKCAGRPLDNFESLDAWTADAGSLSPTNRGEYQFKGSGAADLRAGPGEARVQMSRRFEGGIDLSGWDLSLGARLVAPGAEQLIVQLFAPDHENKVLFVHPIHDQWGWVRLDLGPTGVTGSPDLTDVREMKIGVYTGEGPNARLVVDSLRTTPKAETGRAIMTFDEGSMSIYETAFPILQQYDYPAAVGVSPRDIGERPVDMSVGHLRKLQSAGWDIASYPETRDPLSTIQPLKQRKIIREAKQRLVDHGFEDGAQFLVWPSTQFNHHSLRIASRYHYLGFTGASCLTGQVPTSPTKITRTPANEFSLQKIKRMVDLADEYNQLLVLTSHGIGSGSEMMSEAKFKSIVKYVSESNLTVSTPSTLWANLV